LNSTGAKTKGLQMEYRRKNQSLCQVSEAGNKLFNCARNSTSLRYYLGVCLLLFYKVNREL